MKLPTNIGLNTHCFKFMGTNTKSLAKEFLKIFIFDYFGYLKIGFDVFFDADSELSSARPPHVHIQLLFVLRNRA